MRAHVGKVSRTVPCHLRVRRFEHALQRCLRRGICDTTPRLRPETLTCVSTPLLPSMLGGVTPDSVIREILGEVGWTFCQNYGAASQRRWIQVNSSSPSTLIIKSTGSWPLVVSITRATKGEFGYTNFEITSHWKVSPNGLKPNDAAVETEFVITVPFLGYYSAVLENSSGILSFILLTWASGSSAFSCGIIS